MFFKKAMAVFSGSTNKISGRLDVLQSACAAAAYVSSADGNIGDDEIIKATKSIKATEILASNFSDAQINECLDKMIAKAQSGRAGRAQLIDEINDVASDPELAGLVMYIALDVADNDGIDPKEMQVLEVIARELKLNLQKFLNA